MLHRDIDVHLSEPARHLLGLQRKVQGTIQLADDLFRQGGRASAYQTASSKPGATAVSPPLA